MVEDPRTGNGGPHEFHELLTIALCTTPVRQSECGGHGVVRENEGAVPARVSQA